MLQRVGRKDVRNLAGAFLMAFGITAFLSFFYLMTRWEQLAPSSPDPSHGLIYSHNEHGSITYFSAFQATSLTLLFVMFMLISAVGSAVAPRRVVVEFDETLAFHRKEKPDDPKGLQRVGFIFEACAAPVVIFIIGPSFVNALVAAGFVFPFG